MASEALKIARLKFKSDRAARQAQFVEMLIANKALTAMSLTLLIESLQKIRVGGDKLLVDTLFGFPLFSRKVPNVLVSETLGNLIEITLWGSLLVGDGSSLSSVLSILKGAVI